jgi:cellulose synthase/poly-beta-1,6-N-acetylglucosamine synthase-like glycosyltransferase
MYTNQKNFMEKAYSNVLDLTRKYFKTRQDTTLIYPMRYVPSLIEKEAQEAEEHDNHEHKPVGLNVLLCVKHRNAGKLSSHALFFLGFCEFMQPELCLLLDVGLKPLDNSIFEMYKYMDCNERTGGTCGYMGLRI